MATDSLSQIAPSGNLVSRTVRGNAAVLSVDVAARFGKLHKNVLREITDLIGSLPPSFTELNFEPSYYADTTGRKLPAYLLTRDAFTLLAMGFTGKEALEWKLKYIESFNALEKAALETNTELARQAGYQQGLDEGRSLLCVQAERQQGYLAGLKEAHRIWSKGNSPQALLRLIDLRKKGLTWREIGKIAGISADAAQGRVRRASKRLGVSL